MKKLIFLTVISFLVLTACAPDKSTKNTQNKQQQTEYIINPPDFEELERQKEERLQGKSPKKEKKSTLSKEDSIKNYIKELTHHFHLQEKQMKALEYIYEKYDEKEIQAISQNDSTKFNKLLTEKERSVQVVLGEQLYSKKGEFDEKIIKERLKKVNKTKFGFLEIPPKGIKPLGRASNRYIDALRKELNLTQKQVTKLRSMTRQYAHKKDLLDSIDINQLEESKAKYEKELLGLESYESKLKFDQKFSNKK